MKNLPEALRAFLSDYALYLIAGHSEPDGDCIASALALRSFLQRRGKEAVLLSAGPFNRTETREYAASFRDTLPENMPEQTAVVIVDCSDAGRTGRIIRELMPKAYFVTMYAKPKGQEVVDDFVISVDQDTWILFPWEAELSPASPLVRRQED